MSKPICRHYVAGMQLFKRCRNISARHCDAGVQLFKQCRNLSASTVMLGCSCFSGVKTYLLALCCRGAAVKVVLKPICWDCVAEVQLFKWCQNLSAGNVLQKCSCLSGEENLSAGTVLQRCSCLSGVSTYLPGTVLQGCSCLSCAATYLPALCCWGAAVKMVLKPICRHCVAAV